MSRKRRSAGWITALGCLLLLGLVSFLGVWSSEPSQSSVRSAGAAQWLDEQSFVASSLESGRIGVLAAWGGNEFGYAYSYSLSGQPAALAVDRETGGLTLSSPLPVGDYAFRVVVSNRKAETKVATFSARLAIRQGVKENRSGNQILHTIYRVDDAARFGTPNGNDYSDVLMAINQTIRADQLREGSGNLRATILFRRGRLYQYANNRWPWGVQYLRVDADPDVDPTSPRPRLQGIGVTRWNSLQGAIIRFGRSWGHYYGATTEANLEEPKRFAFPIHTTAPGQDEIRLVDPADASSIKPGRYHMIISYDQQLGGFPPNNRYFDYAKVVSVKGSTVTLDRQLHHAHSEDFLEIPGPNSLGRARIEVLDRGGPGGLVPSDMPFALRSSWNSLEFVTNPSSAEEQGSTVEAEGVLDIEINDCVMPHLVPSNARTVVFVNSRTGSMEGDKQVGLFLADHSEFTSWITECTSVDLFLLRDSKMTTGSMMPAQFRAERSTLDATGDDRLKVPLYVRGPWGTRSIEILDSTITRRDRSMVAIGSGQPAPLATLGVNAAWDGHRLSIPVNSDVIQPWLGTAHEGALVFQGPSLNPSSYGVIRRITGSPRQDALQIDIDWVAGSAPTSGMLSMSFIDELTIGAGSKLEGQAYFGDPGAVRQSVPAGMSPDGNRAIPSPDAAMR